MKSTPKQNEAWMKVWGKLRPECGGVYIVRSGHLVLYIGQSRRVRERLIGHPHKIKFVQMGATDVEFIPEERRYYRFALEKHLQLEMLPLLCRDLHHKIAITLKALTVRSEAFLHDSFDKYTDYETARRQKWLA